MGVPGGHPHLYPVHLLNQVVESGQCRQLTKRSVGIRIEEESHVKWSRGSMAKKTYGNFELSAARFESIF